MRFLLLTLLGVCPHADLPETVPGDQEFTAGHYEAAVAAYHSVLRTSSDSAGVFWRLSRVYVCIADVAVGDRKEALYRQAETYARACVHADSLNSNGYAWLAASLGNLAMLAGSEEKVRLCREIKCHVDRAIELDPANDVAYSILGSFYMALGNVSWFERQLASIFLGGLPDGGFEDAEKALQKAIGLAPNVIRHHYELATLYRVTERAEEAIEEYERVIGLPALVASDPRTQDDARRYLRDLTQQR